MALDSITNTLSSVGETVSALLAKYWTGVLAAIVSLRFVPEESTLGQRAFAAFGGVALTISFGPMAVDLIAIRSEGVVMGIAALIGLFGFLVVGEAVAAIKQAELGPALRDLIRKVLGLKE